jgi:(5-formylfuran-3-yl)methyl phosphate synthase
MSLMLASVNCLAEAQMVYQFNVDIIDLKQPERGALGALHIDAITEIIANIDTGVEISATIGDLPMQPDLLVNAVCEYAATGVDYVKVGFFPGGELRACISALSGLTSRFSLIAVLFADNSPDFAILPELANAGFRGVMLDTMNKQNGRLTQLLSVAELSDFVEVARSLGLISGLAGSLNTDDIGNLLPVNADYLGFRGALCRLGCRTSELDQKQIALIRCLLENKEKLAVCA